MKRLNILGGDYNMDYVSLNLLNRQKMRGLCRNNTELEWEDPEFLDIMKGKLPKPRRYYGNTDISSIYYSLERLCDKYDFYLTDDKELIESVGHLIQEIRKKNPYWSGYDVYTVQSALKMHKFCLISGEGGIGKSYFIKCLEEELSREKVKHICLYGKFQKDVSEIDFEEIKTIATSETFVFAFDAINELPEDQQEILANHVEIIKSVPGVRIIITYRSHTMTKAMGERLHTLSEYEYTFQGVSFESSVEWLQKMPVEDIGEYIDILYSNNPFLLTNIPLILGEQQQKAIINDVSRITHIYEQFIKKQLSRDTWIDTKKITEYLYIHNRKYFSLSEIQPLISQPHEYVAKMMECAFVSESLSENDSYYSFQIESLADYLLVRQMWKELSGKDIDECVALIKTKMEDFPSLNRDSIILMLFDKFSSDYVSIKKIMVETNLIETFAYDVLTKVHFHPESITDFLNVFQLNYAGHLIIYFSGYMNKPFNCTNYLNNYYLDDTNDRMPELSLLLSGKENLGRITGRLKNILYLTCKYKCDKNRALENLYTAIWCTASPNSDVRSLSLKLLFEILQLYPEFISSVIETYEKIDDSYICDAIIHVLSCCVHDERISAFFIRLLKNKDFTLAKSISRISAFLGLGNGYIDYERTNLLLTENIDITDTFERILHHVDLADKTLLPFRYWGMERFDAEVKFISVEKSLIKEFNEKLRDLFGCVQSGSCMGSLVFQEKVEKFFDIDYRNTRVSGKQLLSSFERVLCNTIQRYQLEYTYEELFKPHQELHNSLFGKCFSIAIDILWGSLMCNYYINEFNTFNNSPPTIGYDVYNPIMDGEDINIRSPLCIYQPRIEKIGDIILRKLDLPNAKGDKWWRDLEITKRNLIALLQPFVHNGYEWRLLACRIRVKDEYDSETWSDNYNIYACSSSNEELQGDGNERLLTIEIPNYLGNLFEYSDCSDRPWMCKSVPTLAYESNAFDDTILLLPPAQVIKALELKLNPQMMCWQNHKGEPIILCNNNKASYYQDAISGTVIIRSDAYKRLTEIMPLKYFSFTERFVRGKGFCDETDYHFELSNDGEILKAIPNNQGRNKHWLQEDSEQCKNCIYGFSVTAGTEDSALRHFLQLYGGGMLDDLGE